MIDPVNVDNRSPAGPVRRKLKHGFLVAGVVAASAMASTGLAYAANSDSSVMASSVFEVPSSAALNVIAGQGGAGFGGPALELGFNAPTQVGTDPAGNIYVSSELTGQVGKIAAPSTWNPQLVSTMTATPTFGGPYPTAPNSTIAYSTVGGQYAMTWSDPDAAPNEEIGVQPHPSVTAGTTYTATVTLVGHGEVDIVAGAATSPVVTLSSTPQTVTLTLAPTATSVVFQIRTPSNEPDQPDFSVTASDFKLGLEQVTGDTSLVAGTGNMGYSGDGGPATQASLDFPDGVAADAQGNVFIADRSSNVIRKVSPAGIITTVAGTGTPGYSGDGRAATRAQLNFPGAVAVDSAGDLYIADTDNNAIRKVTPDGTITTVVGGRKGGLSMPEGVAVDHHGDLFVADTSDSRVEELKANGDLVDLAGTGTPGFSGNGGPATQAQLNSPFAVAVDAAGVVYIADTQNDSIRVVAPDGTISTLVGQGTDPSRIDPLSHANITEPFSIAVDNVTGDLYATGNARAIYQITGLGVPTAN